VDTVSYLGQHSWTKTLPWADYRL